MILRRIGKILRGRATPEQLVLSCVLGSMLAFVPGFERGPGLTVALVLVLLISNANIGLAVVTFALTKPVGLLLLPLSFRAGRFLLDGPTSGLFQRAIDTPVLALFGLEHYATSGGLLVGLGFGLVLGVLVALGVNRFRRRMARLEEGSEAYRAFTSRRSVRLLTFVLLGGGRGKKSWEELSRRHTFVPLRWSGVAAAGVVIAGLWIGQNALAGPFLRDALVEGLERANGATVELGALELDVAGGRLYLRELALADPDALDTDLLRAAELEGVVSTRDLLRKRLRVERLLVSTALHGAPRSLPGVRVGPAAPEPAPAPEPREGESTLEDWIAEAEVWKQRLTKAREWLERLQREAPPDSAEARETLEQRLEREARESGLAGVRASHLVTRAPTFSLGELVIDGLTSGELPGEVLAVRLANVSTHPWLLAEAPRLEVRSQSGRIALELGLDPLAAPHAGADPAANRVRLLLADLSGDALGQKLAAGGAPPFSGGHVDLELDGGWAAGGIGRLDLPLAVTLRDTVLAVPGAAPTRVERLALPIGLRGPLDRLAVRFEPRALADALVAAGKAELAGRVREQADELLARGRREAETRLGEKVGAELGDRLGDVLPGDAPADLPGALKGLVPGAVPGVPEESRERPRGALEGIFGGKKKADG